MEMEENWQRRRTTETWTNKKNVQLNRDESTLGEPYDVFLEDRKERRTKRSER